MAKKKKENFREMSPDELRTKLLESKEKLFQLRFQSATAPLKNPHVLRELRRDIARAHTFLKQKGESQ